MNFCNFRIRTFKMRRVLSQVSKNIPLIENGKRKGNMGRIGIIGGSKEYTGAPYFAGITSLFCGADLVHVLCAAAAAPAIKCYSPELIVHPLLDNNLEECLAWMPRLHALVVGPGLGMSENVENTIKIMEAARLAQKPMVVDADGMSIVANHRNIVESYEKVILTPNCNEFGRLYNTILGKEPTDEIQETAKLANALGNVTVVRKGHTDVISDGNSLIVCDSEGSPRRCGGQGDVLSGAAAVFSFWLHESKLEETCSASVAAGVAACALTRECANLAFRKYRRSTVTLKIIDEIQPAFENLFTPSERSHA